MGDYAKLTAAVWSTLAPAPVLAPVYAGKTFDQIAAALNAVTVAASPFLDTSGTAVRAILYARGSMHRVRAWSQQAMTGNAAHDVAVAIAQELVELMIGGAPIAMSQSAIAAAVQSDLATLAATKLSDSKGVIWAAGELAPSDPGDAAVLVQQLSGTIPWWQSIGWQQPIVAADLANALAIAGV